ncbi:MAG: ABC transporter permease, partial [Bacillota bacterium]|nr:ABC transporter permease [Bacillota bacterium]
VTSNQITDITNTLKHTSGVTSYMKSTYKNITIKNKTKSEECSLLVPQHPDEFPKYFLLRTVPTSFKTGDPISLSDNGVVITQQLAQLLNLKKGGTLTIQDDDTHSHSFHIDAIAENYLINYVFMSPASYLKVYGSKVDVNQILTNLSTNTAHDAISSKIMKHNGTAAISFRSDIEQTFHDMVKSLNYVIWLVIISAVLLAFVVLYTLTMINIGERYREIATIKVLGFYDKEVSRYITRENYILTFIGIILGIFGGIFLHSKTLGSIEVDGVIFVKSILPASFVISAALTFLFTWIVNRITMISLRKIDMVEALKGNE